MNIMLQFAFVILSLFLTSPVFSYRNFCCSTAKRWLFNPKATSHINNHGLPSGYIIGRYDVYGLLGCAEICQAMTDCLSFGYQNKPARHCVLYSNTSDAVPLISVLGLQYFDGDAFVLKVKKGGDCTL